MPRRIDTGGDGTTTGPRPRPASAPGKQRLDAGGGGGPGGAPAKKHGGGGGFFHTLGHVADLAVPNVVGRAVRRGAGNLYHIGVTSPAAVYEAGKAAEHDAILFGLSLASGGRPVHNAGFSTPATDYLVKTAGTGYQTPELLNQTAQQYWADVRHPLRNPGYTLVDFLPAANALARVAEVGRGLRAGASWSDALEKPTAPVVLRGAQGVEATTPAARSALGRLVQGTVTDLRNAAPDRRIGLHTQSTRVARIRERQLKTNIAVATQPAAELAYAGRKVGKFSPEGLAMEIVTHGVPVETRLAGLKVDLKANAVKLAVGTAKEQATARVVEKNLQREIRLHEAAKKYLKNVQVGSKLEPVLTDPKLQAIWDAEHPVAIATDQALIDAEIRDPAFLARAVQKQGRVQLGAEWVAPTPGKLGKPSATLLGARAYADRLRNLHARAVAKTHELDFTRAQKKTLGITHPDQLAVPSDLSTEIRVRLPAMEKEVRRLTALHNQPATDLLEQRASLNRLLRLGNEADRAVQAFAEKAGTPGDVAGLAAIQEQVDALTEAIKNVRGQAPEDLTKLRAQVGKLRQTLRAEEAPKAYVVRGENGSYAVGPKGQIIRPRGHERAQKLGAAHSVAEDRATSLETAAAKRVTPTGLVGYEDFTGSQHYVGSRYAPSRRGPLGGRISVGRTGVVNVGKRPLARLQHPLTGRATHEGRIRHDTPAIVAENSANTHKAILAAAHMQDLYDNAAAVSPTGLRDPVAIKSPEAFGKALPQGAQDVVDMLRAGEPLDQQRVGVLGMVWDHMRERVFPKDITAETYNHMSPEDLAALDADGVKWIPRDLLGNLDKGPPLQSLMQYPAGRAGVRFFDAVNNATKFGVLYLKPAYIVPNVVGNGFLVLTQQGPVAPYNIAIAVRLAKKLGPENTRLIDYIMGEGLTSSLAGERGLLGTASTFAAGKYGKIVDVPFRRASFLYEARKELGMHLQKADYDRLLHDPAYRDRLHQVVERANRAVIEYDNLTPFEQDVIRRVLFFYPWLKGSTQYAADYLSGHPNQAALLSLAGQRGEDVQAQLGEIPAWAAASGMFPVGAVGAGNVLTSNPSSAGILSQPAQLAAETAALFGLAPQSSGADARQTLTPGLDILLTALSGKDALGRDVPKNLGSAFYNTAVKGQPALTFAQRGVLGRKTSKTFPLSREQAILQYLFGGLAPRTTNLPALQRSAQYEKYGKQITVLP